MIKMALNVCNLIFSKKQNKTKKTAFRCKQNTVEGQVLDQLDKYRWQIQQRYSGVKSALCYFHLRCCGVELYKWKYVIIVLSKSAQKNVISTICCFACVYWSHAEFTGKQSHYGQVAVWVLVYNREYTVLKWKDKCASVNTFVGTTGSRIQEYSCK